MLDECNTSQRHLLSSSAFAYRKVLITFTGPLKICSLRTGSRDSAPAVSSQHLAFGDDTTYTYPYTWSFTGNPDGPELSTTWGRGKGMLYQYPKWCEIRPGWVTYKWSCVGVGVCCLIDSLLVCTHNSRLNIRCIVSAVVATRSCPLAINQKMFPYFGFTSFSFVS